MFKFNLVFILFSFFALAQAHVPNECPLIQGRYTDQSSKMKITAQTAKIQNGVMYSLKPWAGENEIFADAWEHSFSIGGQNLYQISSCQQSMLTFNVFFASGYTVNKYLFIQYKFKQLNEKGDLLVTTQTSTQPKAYSTVWMKD